MKNIYKGYNPVFESLSNKLRMNEQKSSSSPSDSVVSAINIFFSLILDSKNEEYKNPEKFQSQIGNKLISSNDISSLKSSILVPIRNMSTAGEIEKKYSEENYKFIESTMNSVASSVKDEGQFKEIKEKVKDLVDNFVGDLRNRSNDLKKINPNIVKESLLEKDKRTGEESGVESGEFETASFNKSKECLDASLAFVGEITRDKYIDQIAKDSQVQKFESTANDLLFQAKDLQLVDKKGIKVITASGEKIKRKDYRIKMDSLLNEIIRQKKEYRRIKSIILKKAEIAMQDAPEVPIVVKPNLPEGPKVESPEGTKQAGKCTFPVKVGSGKCEEVQKLQTKIIDLFPSISKFLESRGKADGKYGKGTSKCVNIILGYLNKTKEISLVGDLTKDGYDSIMALEEKDILRKTNNKNESVSNKGFYGNRMFEAEFNEGTPVLKFDSFSKILEYSEYVKEDEEKTLGFKIPEECLDKSIETGEIDLDCIGKSDTAESSTGEIVVPDRSQWKGLKYVNTGSYLIAFDESLLSAWTKEVAITAASFALPGAKFLVKAGSSAAKALTIKSAQKVGAQKLADKLAKIGIKKSIISGSRTKNASQIADSLSKQSAYFFNRYKKVLIPKRNPYGLLGGTLGAATLEFLSGRNSYSITVTEGYIEKSNLLGIVNGLIDTIDGYVSDEDMATIATVLAVIKGAYTIGDDGNPVSAWSFIKEKYKSKEGESIIDDINSIKVKMGDVEGFPKLKSASPQSSADDIAWKFAKDEVVAFLERLESNEQDLSETLKKLPKEYLEALENGDYAEYDEEGNIEGMGENEENEGSEEKTI